MKYLTLSADYGQVALHDAAVGTVDPRSLGLPPELCDDLDSWNEHYGEIVRLDLPERRQPPIAEDIDSLDRRGRELAAAIAECLGDVKIRYYSEGHLRYLD